MQNFAIGDVVAANEEVFDIYISKMFTKRMIIIQLTTIGRLGTPNQLPKFSIIESTMSLICGEGREINIQIRLFVIEMTAYRKTIKYKLCSRYMRVVCQLNINIS